MKIGDLCSAEIEYDDGSGKKVRPVIILKILASGSLAVIHSRSKFKSSRAGDLVLKIEISPTHFRQAWHDGFGGTSHFYSINVSIIQPEKIRKNYGRLSGAEMENLRVRLKEFF